MPDFLTATRYSIHITPTALRQGYSVVLYNVCMYRYIIGRFWTTTHIACKRRHQSVYLSLSILMFFRLVTAGKTMSTSTVASKWRCVTMGIYRVWCNTIVWILVVAEVYVLVLLCNSSKLFRHARFHPALRNDRVNKLEMNCVVFLVDSITGRRLRSMQTVLEVLPVAVPRRMGEYWWCTQLRCVMLFLFQKYSHPCLHNYSRGFCCWYVDQ